MRPRRPRRSGSLSAARWNGPREVPGLEGLDAAFRRAILHNYWTPIDVTWTGWRSGFQPGIENRALTKASGNVIGTSIYGEIICHLVEGSAVLSAGARMLTTSSGETRGFPGPPPTRLRRSCPKAP